MTSPTVWITRTQPAAAQSGRVWEAAGARPLIAPLLQVTTASTPPKPSHADVLVFTSANGVRSFAKIWQERHWQVVCVGDATARAAREAGFKSAASAQGTSVDVTAFILANIDPKTPVIHCAGKHVRGSITEDLREAGYAARRDLYYFSTPVAHMPYLEVRPDWAALYSPLAAQTLARLAPNLSATKIISISAATDAALDDFACAGRYVASAPTETALLSAWLQACGGAG